jgi:heme oxygenase
MASNSVEMAHDSSAAPRTLLLRLKDETRDVHESLERDLDLLRPDLTLERYQSVVERFYGFYHPWENAVKPLLSEGCTTPTGQPRGVSFFGALF